MEGIAWLALFIVGCFVGWSVLIAFIVGCFIGWRELIAVLATGVDWIVNGDADDAR